MPSLNGSSLHQLFHQSIEKYRLVPMILVTTPRRTTVVHVALRFIFVSSPISQIADEHSISRHA